MKHLSKKENNMLKVFMVIGWILVIMCGVASIVALLGQDYSQAFESLKSGLMLAASLYFLKAVSA
jgi:hypothetical protein